MQKHKREILLQENEILKEKIKHLEAKIDQHQRMAHIKINENSTAANKNKYFPKTNINKYSTLNQEEEELEEANKESNLVMELKIWKNRSETMTENYISALNGLRNQLKQDKKHYVDLIQNMQTEFNSEVDRLKKAYEGSIIRNEKIVKKLKKENEDITQKLGKVKDIIALSSQNNYKKK